MLVLFFVFFFGGFGGLMVRKRKSSYKEIGYPDPSSQNWLPAGFCELLISPLNDAVVYQNVVLITQKPSPAWFQSFLKVSWQSDERSRQA